MMASIWEILHQKTVICPFKKLNKLLTLIALTTSLPSNAAVEILARKRIP
jgi:hypothetical protein